MIKIKKNKESEPTDQIAKDLSAIQKINLGGLGPPTEPI